METAAGGLGDEVEGLKADRDTADAVWKTAEVRCGGWMRDPPSTGCVGSGGSMAGRWALIDFS
ncbi:MAG: hypothetical protein ACYC0V_13675 [Armatimonadota bacterium]